MLLEIHPVTGTMVDSQFRDPFTNWLDIARVSRSEPLDPDLNARSRLDIPQVVEPLRKEVSFADLNHDVSVALWLQNVNPIYILLHGGADRNLAVHDLCRCNLLHLTGRRSLHQITALYNRRQ